MSMDRARGGLYTTNYGRTKDLPLRVPPEDRDQLPAMNDAWRRMLRTGDQCGIAWHKVRQDCDQLIQGYQTPKQFMAMCDRFARRYKGRSLESTPLGSYFERHGRPLVPFCAVCSGVDS